MVSFSATAPIQRMTDTLLFILMDCWPDEAWRNYDTRTQICNQKTNQPTNQPNKQPTNQLTD